MQLLKAATIEVYLKKKKKKISALIDKALAWTRLTLLDDFSTFLICWNLAL